LQRTEWIVKFDAAYIKKKNILQPLVIA